MNQPKELSQEDIERFGALTDVKAQESKEQLMKCLNVKLQTWSDSFKKIVLI